MADCLAQFRTAWLYAPGPPAPAAGSSGPFADALRRAYAIFKNKASVESRATADAGRIIAKIRARKTAGTLRPSHQRPCRFAHVGM